LPTQGRAQYQKATAYLNNFKETFTDPPPGGVGICGGKGFSRLTDGDDASGGDGASTSLADWNSCCAGFGVGAGNRGGDGGVYGGNGRS